MSSLDKLQDKRETKLYKTVLHLRHASHLYYFTPSLYFLILFHASQTLIETVVTPACLYVGVLVICILVFTVFCIVCTVFAYCFHYAYFFLFVFSVLV